jgi:hypothetical protein
LGGLAFNGEETEETAILDALLLDKGGDFLVGERLDCVTVGA